MDMSILKTFSFNNNSYIDLVNVNTSTLQRYVKVDSVALPPITSSVEMSTPKSAKYDGTGAMYFIVTTVIVFSSFGLLCTVFSKFRRTDRSKPSNVDEEVGRYLKKERRLKLEGHKCKLLNEMKNYTDAIRRYEKKMRINEIEKELEEERRRTEQVIFEEQIVNKLGNTSKRKRQTLYLQKKKQTSIPGCQLSMTDNTLGKMGFSFLFMTGSDRQLSAFQETTEDDTAEEETAFLKTPSLFKHVRKTSADGRLETIIGNKATGANKETPVNIVEPSDATEERLSDEGEDLEIHSVPGIIQSDIAKNTATLCYYIVDNTSTVNVIEHAELAVV
ncbi:hypothetical protein DPMN_092845 [Dreissena polymorpha]|uniref:Uncharacterized protein n=1 Tax=Dreissena polymorpha TaxID=45954 RepID=A0A9D4L341_DREPO|nr:hypothetical protein DPMN_092845 [Dreissena polymorpha]